MRPSLSVLSTKVSHQIYYVNPYFSDHMFCSMRSLSRTRGRGKRTQVWAVQRRLEGHSIEHLAHATNSLRRTPILSNLSARVFVHLSPHLRLLVWNILAGHASSYSFGAFIFRDDVTSINLKPYVTLRSPPSPLQNKQPTAAGARPPHSQRPTVTVASLPRSLSL